MAQFNAHRSKAGADAAKARAAAATTPAERKRWEHTEQVWKTRWKAALAGLGL